MSAKKTKLGIFDIGRILPSPVENKSGYEDAKTLWNRLKAEEVEAQKAAEQKAYRESPMGRVEQEFQATTRDIIERVRRFYSLPIAQMQEFVNRESPCDCEDYPMLESARDSEVEQALWYEFYEKLKSQGIEISTDGWIRVSKYLTALAIHRNIALTLETMQRAIERLNFLGCFQPGEVTGTIPKPAYAVTPQRQAEPQKPAVDPMELWSTEKRDELKMIQNLVGRGWAEDYIKWFLAWRQSLKDNFDFDLPESLHRKIEQVMTERNLPHNSYKSWDVVRVAFVRLGLFPPTCLTPKEELDIFIENSDLSDVNVRREINTRARLLADDRPRPPR